MQDFTVSLTPETAVFFRKVAFALDLPIEQVLADALFQAAGDLSRRLAERRGD